MGEKIRTQELFAATNGAVTKAGTLTTDEIDLTGMRLEGTFSLHTIHVGGDITVTVLVSSTRKGTYVAPSTPIVVVADFAAGTGFWAFTPPLAPFMKLLFTENDTNPITSMYAWLNFQ